MSLTPPGLLAAGAAAPGSSATVAALSPSVATDWSSVNSGAWSFQCLTMARTSSSSTQHPWTRWGLDDEGPSISRSPLPTSRSAPGWSRITRESVRLDTANARRAGTFALMTPVMTLTDGRWVAITRWMPTARAIWAMRAMESSTSRAATIMRSASSSTTTRMNGRRRYWSGFAVLVGLAEPDLERVVVRPRCCSP